MAVDRPLQLYLDRADPEVLYRAVAVVYEKYRSQRMHPGADYWIADLDKYRPQMIADVKREWSTVSGTDEYFPFSDGLIWTMWAAWRRQSTPLRLAACDQLGITTEASAAEGN